jgi:hypothetical protein
MATRSVHTVEIDDTAFKRLKDLSEEYQKKLTEIVGLYGAVNTQIDRSTKAAQGAAGAAEDLEDNLSEADEAAENLNRSVAKTEDAIKGSAERQYRIADSLHTQERSWFNMNRDASFFADHIKNATESLLKWGSLTGLISGILGLGGLFGIERLASNAAGTGRSAAGLGVTPGQQLAFETNFKQFVDPDALLSGVNEALSDPTKAAPFGMLGLNYTEEQRKGTAIASNDVLQALYQWSKRTDPGIAGTLIQNTGLGQIGFNLEDYKRLRATDQKTFDEQLTHNQSDQETANFNAGPWQKLVTQFERAGNTIEALFTNKLVSWAPQIAAISDGFVKLAGAFLNNPEITKWINAFGETLKHWAAEIGTADFQGYLDRIASGIGQFAEDIWAVVPSVHSAVQTFISLDKYLDAIGKFADGDPSELWSLLKQGVTGASTPEEADQRVKNAGVYTTNLMGYADDRLRGRPAGYSLMQKWTDLDQKYGLSPGTVGAIEQQESGGDPNAHNGSHLGAFEFGTDAAKRFGVNPWDETSSAEGAAKYIQANKALFGGDEREAIAGYTAGEGTVQEDVKNYGADWFGHLTPKQQQYVNSVEAALSYQRQQALVVHNNTGGSALTSAQLLPFGMVSP